MARNYIRWSNATRFLVMNKALELVKAGGKPTTKTFWVEVYNMANLPEVDRRPLHGSTISWFCKELASVAERQHAQELSRQKANLAQMAQDQQIVAKAIAEANDPAAQSRARAIEKLPVGLRRLEGVVLEAALALWPVFETELENRIGALKADHKGGPHHVPMVKPSNVIPLNKPIPKLVITVVCPNKTMEPWFKDLELPVWVDFHICFGYGPSTKMRLSFSHVIIVATGLTPHGIKARFDLGPANHVIFGGGASGIKRTLDEVVSYHQAEHKEKSA